MIFLSSTLLLLRVTLGQYLHFFLPQTFLESIRFPKLLNEGKNELGISIIKSKHPLNLEYNLLEGMLKSPCVISN